jgi:hypothetical protein
VPFAENLGTGGGTLDAQYGSAPTVNGNAPLLLDHDGTNYAYLPGLAGNYLGVTDSAALDITGDLDVRVLVMLDAWNTGAEQTLIAKFTNLSVNRSWQFRIGTTGALQLVTSADGTAILTHTSSVVPSLFSGVAYWLRATIDVASGSDRVVQFFQAPFSATTPVAWTQIGTTITTAGTTSIFNGAAPLTLGSINAGLSVFGAGRFYRAQVLSGISGTVVLDTNLSTMITTGSETAMLSTGPGSPIIPEPSDTLPNLGWGGFSLNARYGSAVGPDTNDPLLLTRTTENYVYLPGVALNYAVVGNAPALNITGDIDIRVRVALDDWTSAPSAGIQHFVSKYHESTAGYYFGLLATGELRIGWTLAGVDRNATSTVATGIADGTIKWVRATLDVDNGASGRSAQFFTSDDGVTWTQLGTTVTQAGTTSIGVTPTGLVLGAYGIAPSVFLMQGKFYRAQVLDGIGGTVALDVDFTTGIVNGAQTSLAISGTAADQLDNALVLTNLGTGGPVLNAQRGSNLAAADTNDPAVLSHTGTNYLYLSGVANNYASTPDSAALDITGDIDIRVRVALDDWTPAAAQTLLAKYGGSGARSYLFDVQTAGTLRFQYTTGGVTGVSVTSSVATGIADGSIKWVRVAFDVDNGAAGNTGTFYTSDDGVTWAQLGAPVTAAGVVAIASTAAPLEIGSFASGSSGLAAAKFYLAQVLSGIGGTVVFDANFSTGIISGAQTTFTESSTNAATVTINRSTSGRRSVAVVQPTLLFGTDDYMDVANNDLLNFGAGQNFTVIAANRTWATAGNESIVAKKANFATNDLGWALGRSTTTTRARMGSDTSYNSNNVDAAGSYGALTLSGLVVVANTSMTVYNNATTAVAATPPTGSFASTFTMRIGNTTSGTPFNGELFGAAIWRRALSAAEIALVNTHYNGTVTPASLALLGEAVFWVDPARSKQAAAIARSTSGRKAVAVTRDTMLFGTDDYLEVPDSDLIDFGAADSFTVAVVVRQWATSPNFAPHVSKIQAASTGVGYAITNNSTFTTSNFTLADGVIPFGSNVTSSTYTFGTTRVLTGVVNRQDQTGKIFTGGVENNSISIAAIGSFASSNPLRFGTVGAGVGGFADMEFFGAAVFRRALSAAEIATVNAHYQTGPTTASTALLREAVLWLDPSQRRVATLNRASAGRRSVAVPTAVWSLATDDWFEVPDSVLLDMGAGQDFTALVIQRPWWLQGSSDTLVAKVDTTTVTAQGWAVSNPTTGDALRTAGRIGDGSAGAEAFGPQRLTGQRQAAVLVRSGGTLTSWTGGAAGTPVAATTGDLSNGSVMRIGRLSGAGTEYLDSEIRAVAVWRRALTTAEITAVLNYYGAA